MTTTAPTRRYLAPAFAGLTITPAPDNLTPGQTWHESGTHRIDHPDGRIEVCGCGPANQVTGPRWAVVRGVKVYSPGMDV